MKRILEFFFGQRAQGEKLEPPKTRLVLYSKSHSQLPSFNEWCKEFRVSSKYTIYGALDN